MSQIFSFVIFFFLLINLGIDGDMKLVVVNNGPVVRTSNITFYATLEGATHSEYEWEWKDDAKPQFYLKQTAGTSMNVSKAYNNHGHYTMTVTVTKFLFIKVSTKNEFNISSMIPGQLKVYQFGEMISRTGFVSSNNETLVEVWPYDPGHLLNPEFEYFVWYIDGIPLSDELKNNLTYTFSPPKDYVVVVMLSAFIRENIDFLHGNYMVTVRSRAPITTVNITGKTILQHGEMVDLQVECDGSSPWSYCWMAVPEENGTQIENSTCSEMLMTNDCQFTMLHYFDKSGHHQMLVNISNDINRRIVVQDITIYSAVPEPQLSTVLIPVVCSLLAVAIIVIGIFYFVQSRRTFIIEVADFDFTSSDTFTYRTFCQQLKDAIAESIASRSAGICERHWNFLDCRSEPEGEADPSTDDDILNRRQSLTNSTED